MYLKDMNMSKVKFGQLGKVYLDDDTFNYGTDQEYIEAHFKYETDDYASVIKFGEDLQKTCDEKGYGVYVNVEVFREIKTITIEIHNIDYRDEAHINEAIEFIADYAKRIK